jgi:hypothetical protein
MRTEQSFTGLGSEDWCSSWGLNKVLLVLGRRTGAHHEDWTKFYWSWTRGLVLIVRTEQSLTGLGSEDPIEYPNPLLSYIVSQVQQLQYVEHLTMIFYVYPSNYGILTPLPMMFWSSIHGISTFSCLKLWVKYHIWHIEPPTHDILNSLLVV